MNKDEIIDQYVKELSLKLDIMPDMFAKTSLSDRKHMENGFRYAVISSVEALKVLLDGKKDSGLKAFIKQLAPKPPTQEDVEKEKLKIALETQKLELAKLRSERSSLTKQGGSPIGDFVRRGSEYDPFNSKKKK